jgi:putative membrane protein
MWWSDVWFWWAWPLMAFGMLAFWGAVAWIVVVVLRSSQRADNRRRPEEILGERLARGEIDEAEYGRRLSTLRSTAGRR